MTTLRTITEPPRETPIWHECDLCVIGGSCTGVFAAVRAARLGLRVILVERMGCFGGVATISLVNIWHSHLDEAFERPIIGGLTVEIMERLKKRQSVTTHDRSSHAGWSFNPQELQIELDELVRESRVHPLLHTAFVAPYIAENQLRGILVENKSGRGVILASQFIDASGDGDLAARMGLPHYFNPSTQPSTTCAIFSGWDSLKDIDWRRLIRDHGDEFQLPAGFAWGCNVPPSNTYMLAGTRVYNPCHTGEDLTQAEMEGRRQVRAIHDLLRKYAPTASLTLQTLPSRLGIRETRHIRCRHQMKGDDVLNGCRYDDAVVNGSYRVDIHHHDKPGITLRYLDGREEYARPGYPLQHSRWRPETTQNPTFYQLPYRSLLTNSCPNLLVAGRMIDADPVAHAAIRVMVNLNQAGEAAGVAAALAVRGNVTAIEVNPQALRQELARGGSIVI